MKDNRQISKYNRVLLKLVRGRVLSGVITGRKVSSRVVVQLLYFFEFVYRYLDLFIVIRFANIIA